ncbi:hypothetical protein C8Q74DRAFT_1311503 [Fomes fomentarius]|nr:hypothetical protein C8Q74DRAFT_1311503 [Fomes fomentarius]
MPRHVLDFLGARILAAARTVCVCLRAQARAPEAHQITIMIVNSHTSMHTHIFVHRIYPPL